MAVASAIPVHLFTGGNQVPDVDPNEWLLSTGIRSASFQNVGDQVVGYIARQPEVQQQRDFETGELKHWSDGNPMMQLRVVLSTELRDPDDPEDSGERAIYIRGKHAARGRPGGARRQRARPGGGRQAAHRVRRRRQGGARGYNPPKVYEAKYRAPERESAPAGDPVRETVPATAAAGSANHKDEVPF